MSAATLVRAVKVLIKRAIGHRLHDNGQGRERCHHRLLPDVVRPAVAAWSRSGSPRRFGVSTEPEQEAGHIDIAVRGRIV